MSSDTATPKVFVSYSHDSQEHKDRVLALSSRLRAEGVDCNIDQYEEWPSEGWPRWMLNQLEEADFVLVVATEQYSRRFQGRDTPGKGRGVTWEGAVITQDLYDASVHNDKFIPVVFSAADEEHIPIILRPFNRYRVGAEDGYRTLYRLLTHQPLTPKPPLGERVDQPPRTLPALSPRERKQTFPYTPDFFAYDDAWVGRETLLQDLSARIRTSCRLLILVGITGIGKTALAERLTVEVADWFGEDWSRYHQENFDNEEQASDFASVSARWLERWGQAVTLEDRKEPQRLLQRAVDHLREHRYFVQVDSIERILQGNEEEGWSEFQDEWWVRFFRSLLTAESCQSCVVITSQDLPGQIEEAVSRSQPLWHCQPLAGLTELERLSLFEKTGLDISPHAEGKAYLERIGQAYEGHPLALRIIAGEIGNPPFRGNVIAYWHRHGTEIEEIEKAIEEAEHLGISVSADDRFQLDRYTRNLRRHVHSRLEQTFSRLREDVHDAYILLCEASVYRCPVPEAFWLSHLEDWERDDDQQRLALDALRDRYLVEELIENNRCLLRQHNLVRSVSLEHLRHLGDDDE